MTQILLGPVNISQNNSARFVVEFLDSAGNITSPSAGTVYVTYTNTSSATQVDTVSLTLSTATIAGIWTGQWSSTSAALGIATWTLYGSDSSNVRQTGTLRVISP